MKITVRQYAQGLYETVSTIEDVDIESVLNNFARVLSRDNVLDRADQIIKEFTIIWNRNKGIVEGNLISATEISDEMTELLNSSIVKLLGVKEVKLNNKIDKSVLGGFIVKLEDVIIDGSLKTKLYNLKNKLVN